MEIVVCLTAPFFPIPLEFKGIPESELRTNSDLITAIKLGELEPENGIQYSIVTIPDNVKYKITENSIGERVTTYIEVSLQELKEGLSKEKLQASLNADLILIDPTEKMTYSDYETKKYCVPV